MKLLLENWRQYLNESEGAPIDINKLLAMPVDQAIAIMDALVDDIDNSKLLEDYENALEEKYEMVKANRRKAEKDFHQGSWDMEETPEQKEMLKNQWLSAAREQKTWHTKMVAFAKWSG